MPFDEFFAEQLELIKDFVVTPDAAVNVIEVDGEMQGILMRMLAGLDNDPGFPHALIGYYEAFTDPSALTCRDEGCIGHTARCACRGTGGDRRRGC